MIELLAQAVPDVIYTGQCSSDNWSIIINNQIVSDSTNEFTVGNQDINGL